MMLVKPFIEDEPKYAYGQCPECGSTDLSVYLLADYNSTIDEFNKVGCVSWTYSDAMTDIYCNERDLEVSEFDLKEVKKYK